MVRQTAKKQKQRSPDRIVWNRDPNDPMSECIVWSRDPNDPMLLDNMDWDAMLDNIDWEQPNDSMMEGGLGDPMAGTSEEQSTDALWERICADLEQQQETMPSLVPGEPDDALWVRLFGDKDSEETLVPDPRDPDDGDPWWDSLFGDGDSDQTFVPVTGDTTAHCTGTVL